MEVTVMNYSLVESIKKVIEECKIHGNAELKHGQDHCGDPEIWLSASYREYDDTHDVIVVYFHYTDTGRIIHGTQIKETIRKRK